MLSNGLFKSRREDHANQKWLESKENADGNDMMQGIVETQTDTAPPPAKRARYLAPQQSCSSVQSHNPLKFKGREFFVPAVLSPEGFQRLFKAITGLDFFPCWKPAKKTTRFIFRKTTENESLAYTFNNERMDVATVTERLMAEHAKPSREPVTIEVRSRKVQQDIYIADWPEKFNRKGIEGALLDDSFTNAKVVRCLYVPEIIDDNWLLNALYAFVTAEQERLFSVQVPQWTRQKKKRLDMIRTEISRLQSVDRSPSSVTYLARSVAISMVQGVSILLNGSVRRNYPLSTGRVFAAEIIAFADALGDGPQTSDLLPDKRFSSWAAYAKFFECDRKLVEKLHSKEMLHGGASYARLTMECEAAVRFARPELPDTTEALFEYLRERILQGGGVTRLTWRNIIDKILNGAAQNVLQQAIKYVSCRNQWFLMEHKTHAVAWLCTLSGSSDEFNYPAIFMKHAQVMHERKDIVDTIYEHYDDAISKLATRFERSFIDVLVAIFSDLPGFFARLKNSWELEPVKDETAKPETKSDAAAPVRETTRETTRVLLLKPIAGYKCKPITCDPRKVDDEGQCMTFGRNESNRFVESDLRVSGNHFAIKASSSGWTLLDRSSNGTWVNGDKVGKGKEVALNDGDTIGFLNPNAQLQPSMGFTIEFKAIQDGPHKTRAAAVSRVLREMKRSKTDAVCLDGVFDPMMLEQYLPKISNFVLRGFELLRSWVAEQVPLFIEAFFRRPLESRLMDTMGQIEIETCSDLPEIDAKMKRLLAEETEVQQLIKDLHERKNGV